MSRKSRNNRRKTLGRFTTNPTQYMQFQNRDKYDHIIHEGHITVINKKTQDVKEVFDYEEVCRYLEVNNGQSPESPTHLDPNILSHA